MKPAFLLFGLICALAGACSRNTGPSSSAADATNTPSMETPTAPATGVASPADPQPVRVDGTPEIAMEPDGVHIEYRRYGTGDPAVILIHGWATDANYWNAQIEPLKAHYTVVAVDLAGHGASTHSRNDWSMGSFGEDVATVARQLQNRQIILVGHAMGGTVALEATPRIGDRVIGIIAVDALKSVGLPVASRSDIELRVAPFRADFVGSVRRYATGSLFEKGADPVLVQKIAYDMSLEPPEVGVPALQGLLAEDFSSLLPRIHVPVLAINSDLDPTDEARIRKSLPDFRADIVPHTGQFLMMEAPQKFNPILLRDIDTLVRRAAH